jgi:putative ABC transport system ATP-binding protein
MFDSFKQLTFNDVSYSVPDLYILKNINVTLTNRNKITGIVGPSGSGKTTFLRLINKLISPTNGTIILNEELQYSNLESRELRRKVGLLQQHPFLFPGTVRENIEYGPLLWNKTLSTKEIQTLLEKVNLDPFIYLDRIGSELSGGEQQRVCLARTLANNPCVLLLDEPTSSLDIASEEMVEESLIKLVKKDNIKVIIVTHSLEQTKRLSDEVIFLKDGKIECQTSTKEFFNKYSDKQIVNLFKKETKEDG